jgi:hypothetical protein
VHDAFQWCLLDLKTVEIRAMRTENNSQLSEKTAHSASCRGRFYCWHRKRSGLIAPFFYGMASHFVLPGLQQSRGFAAAAIIGQRAAWMEGTA